MNKNAKILVTGGSGLIGSYLLRNLVRSGFTDLHAIHLPDDSLDLVHDIKSQISWYVADITDSVTLNDIFSDVHTVIHCAGVISFWPKEFKEMFRVNVDGSSTIVNLCLEHQVECLIYLSSIEAIGTEEDNSTISEKTEWKEDTQHTQYAVSKYLGELEAWRGIAEGLNVIIYNPALVLGTGYWDIGPMSLIKDIHNGLRYYPQGSIAMIDVRDLVMTIIDNIGNKEMFGSRFIVGSYNIKFKKLLDQIADNLNVTRPNKTLSGFTAKIAISMERMRASFTNSKPLINKETYLVTSQDLNYSFDGLNSVYKLKSRSIDHTLTEMARVFKDSYPNNEACGLLPS